MDYQLVFLTPDEKVAFIRDDAQSAIHHRAKLYLEAKFKIDPEKTIREGMYVTYKDANGKNQLFIIGKPKTNIVKQTVSFTAELAAMVELTDENIIEDKRPSNCQAGAAADVALLGTRWQLGTVEATGIGSNRFYYQNPWSSLQAIKKTYGCDFDFYITIADEGITGRYVDVYQDIGRDLGLRLEIDKNMDDLEIDIDDTAVRTALYGRGKGEEVGTTDDGDPTYGRRITFADIVWSKANGDPCDKPAGQEWLEDTDATALYGRNGRKRIDVVIFENCTDPNELIQLTWDHLQEIKAPKITVKATIRNLEDRFGYAGEAVGYGDYATVIVNDTMAVRARVSDADINLVDGGQTKLTIGNAVVSIVDMQVSTAEKLNAAQERIDIAGQIAVKNPELYKGILNTMVTQILSTGTTMYTDPNDGSFVYVADDGMSAVKITGRGLLISDEKQGDEFIWTTALDGTGMTADVITAGTLRANLVKILGTDMFYWDSQAIFIYDESDETRKRQIRIGRYDGVHHGIGYTIDGGKTWQTAIGFDGIVLGAQSVTQSSLSQEVSNAIQGAATAAGNAQTTADGKGRVWYQTTAPTPANEKDLWIDTTDGNNVPKRWNGTNWVAVSDGTKLNTSKFTLDSKEITAAFNRIGITSYGGGSQTGIVRADIDGVEVTHSDAGSKTRMMADGFKIIRISDGAVIGGVFKSGDRVYTAMQSLINPDVPGFEVAVSPHDWGEGIDAYLKFIVSGIDAGHIFADTHNGALLTLSSNGTLRLQDENYSVSVDELYASVHRIHFGLSDPGGNDGDIWLCPVDPMDVS